MAVQYFKVGALEYAWATAASILLVQFFQLLLVLLQNWKSEKWGARFLLKEIGLVLLCVKPGLAAMKVAADAEGHENHMFPPKVRAMSIATTSQRSSNVSVHGHPLLRLVASSQAEYTFLKAIELCFEAVPNTLIQTYAYLKGRDVASGAIFSIAVSVLTGAFTASSVSYDSDVQVSKRESSPEFYGYVPDRTSDKLKVRSGEERRDALRRRVYGLSTSVSNASLVADGLVADDSLGQSALHQELLLRTLCGGEQTVTRSLHFGRHPTFHRVQDSETRYLEARANLWGVWSCVFRSNQHDHKGPGRLLRPYTFPAPL